MVALPRKRGRLGQAHCSIELARQWIYENWEEYSSTGILIIDYSIVPVYYRDLASTGMLEDDEYLKLDFGFVGIVRWNLTTNTLDRKDLRPSVIRSLFIKFTGAGLTTRALSLEMRLLTPDFKSLESTYTIIRSFYDAPIILPYELLGKLIDSHDNLSIIDGQIANGTHPVDETTTAAITAPRPPATNRLSWVGPPATNIVSKTTTFTRIWSAGPVTAAVIGIGISRHIELKWDGGCTDYDGYGYNRLKIYPETYENGIVLHLTPCTQESGLSNDNRYATVMMIKK